MLKQYFTISLNWSDIQHSSSEIVCCSAVFLSSVYDNHIKLLYVWTFLPLSIYMSISAFWALMSIFSDFSAWSLFLSMMLQHFVHNISLISAFVLFWKKQVLYSCDRTLLTLEFVIFALWPPVNQDIQKGMIKQSKTIFGSGQYWSHLQHLYRRHIRNCLLLFKYVYIKSDRIHYANGPEQCVELHIPKHKAVQ